MEFSVYRKPTHTDQYLQFDSHQPLKHKLGVGSTLKHHACFVSSTPQALDTELKHLDMVISVSGYPRLARAGDPHTYKTMPPP